MFFQEKYTCGVVWDKIMCYGNTAICVQWSAINVCVKYSDVQQKALPGALIAIHCCRLTQLQGEEIQRKDRNKIFHPIHPF